jgi:hypothetical protein
VRLSGSRHFDADLLPAVVPSGFPALIGISWGAGLMAKFLYRIVCEGSSSCAVEVTDGGTLRHIGSGFQTEAEAEAWATAQGKATRGIDQWERQIDQPRRHG